MERAGNRRATGNVDVRGHMPALDGLRGVALLIVLFHHATNRVSLEGAHPISVHVFQWLGTGAIGVDLFFVLSGFLITGILLDTRGDRRRLVNFFARRSLRILPLYYGVLAVFFFVLPAVFEHSVQLRNLRDVQLWHWIYLQNFIPLITGSELPMREWVGHFWTLAVEEQFYIVWPLVIYGLRVRTVAWLAVAILALSPVLRLAVVLNGWEINISEVTPARLDGLVLGSLLAIAARRGEGLAPLRHHAWSVMVAGVVVVSLLRGLDLYGELPFNLMQTVGRSFITVLFGAMLVFSLTAGPSHPAVAPLHWRSVRRIGKYSYAMYVFHLPVMTLAAFRWPEGYAWHGQAIVSLLIYTAFTGAVTFGLAFLSWHLWEKHFLKLKRHFAYESTTAHSAGG